MRNGTVVFLFVVSTRGEVAVVKLFDWHLRIDYLHPDVRLAVEVDFRSPVEAQLNLVQQLHHR